MTDTPAGKDVARAAHRKRLVSIIGGRAANVGDRRALEIAEQVGAELARRGYGVVSGGDDGVAEAANKGCYEAGGTTIALTKGLDLDCGPYVTYVIPTSIDLSRSAPLLWSGDGVIAFDGRFGTMFEIAFALDTARPLVIVGTPAFVSADVAGLDGVVMFPDPHDVDAATVVDALERLLGPT